MERSGATPMRMDDVSACKLVFNLRELLTNVLGFAELMSDPYVDPCREKRLEYAEIIYASGLRLTEQVERFTEQIEVSRHE
jgi:hypothetical protein